YFQGDPRTVVCMDWGISLNLLMLSSGSLHTLEPWQQFLYSQGNSPEMAKLILTPNQVYVFHAPRYAAVNAITTYDGPRQTFFSTVAALGRRAILEKSFVQQDGDELFEVYRVDTP